MSESSEHKNDKNEKDKNKNMTLNMKQWVGQVTSVSNNRVTLVCSCFGKTHSVVVSA